MYLSLSKSTNSFDASKHRHFHRATGEFKNLSKIITSRTWSPIVFKQGIRASENFESSELIALDFDSGMSIDDAVEYFRHLTCIIGTTRSHRIAKGGEPPCDRFRVILHAEICEQKENYEFTLEQISEWIGSDSACKDSARLFFPCTTVVFQSESNHKLSWMTAPKSNEAQKFNRALLKAKAQFRKIPDWLDVLIRRGIDKKKYPNESRHEAVWKIGAELYKRGFTEQEIISYMEMSSSPLMEYVGHAECIRAVHGGIERIKRDTERFNGSKS